MTALRKGVYLVFPIYTIATLTKGTMRGVRQEEEVISIAFWRSHEEKTSDIKKSNSQQISSLAVYLIFILTLLCIYFIAISFILHLLFLFIVINVYSIHIITIIIIHLSLLIYLFPQTLHCSY